MFNNKKLKKEIDIKNKYAELIVDLAVGYDGLNTVESLKGLIDELSSIAKLIINSNDKEVIYINGNNKYNILYEKIGEKKDGLY